MPARTRDALADIATVVAVSTSLPAHIVDLLNDRTKKKYQPRATYLREAILDAMRGDGMLAEVAA